MVVYLQQKSTVSGQNVNFIKCYKPVVNLNLSLYLNEVPRHESILQCWDIFHLLLYIEYSFCCEERALMYLQEEYEGVMLLVSETGGHLG
jgi:hypothetical protein